MGIGVGILAYFLFNLSLSYMQTGVVALYSNLIPVFTVLFAFLLLGEKINMLQLAGICIALFGILISTINNK